MSIVVKASVLMALLLVGGCAHYSRHGDAVAYSAGDAVRANLEGQTTNPAKGSAYVTSGLGKNGVVAPGG